MFSATIKIFAFNKALADLGLGSSGFEPAVHRELRMNFIEICVAGGVSTKLAASKLFFVYEEIGLISPSHRRTARRQLDLWAAKQTIPDPDDLKAEIASLIRGENQPDNAIDDLCRKIGSIAIEARNSGL